jgi:hypothetical protein
MKIHLVGVHEYPGRLGGMASTRVADCLAKGLAELGHEVSYELPSAFVGSLPDGVQLVHERRFDVDIMWFNGSDAGRLSPLACRIFAMEITIISRWRASISRSSGRRLSIGNPRLGEQRWANNFGGRFAANVSPWESLEVT